MDLQVGQSINNNKVRLDFRKSPSRPPNAPSYIIERDMADEFVSKYNKQEKRLSRSINIAAGILAVVGLGAAIRKKSLKTALLWTPLSVLAVFGIGAAISAHRKNNLMDRYQVREYSVRSYF